MQWLVAMFRYGCKSYATAERYVSPLVFVRRFHFALLVFGFLNLTAQAIHWCILCHSDDVYYASELADDLVAELLFTCWKERKKTNSTIHGARADASVVTDGARTAIATTTFGLKVRSASICF